MNYWIGIYAQDDFIIRSSFDEMFKEIKQGPMNLYYQKNDKYINDQLFEDINNGIVVSDGLILNLSELLDTPEMNDLKSHITKEIAGGNSLYFNQFRGPFAGLYYDNKTETLIAYGNQTGDAPVFYTVTQNYCLVSNDLNLIVAVMKENHIEYSFDYNAAKCLCSFGYMIDESTMIGEIKRLTPCTALTFSNGQSSIQKYDELVFEDQDMSFEDAIEKVDVGFRKAVKRCYEKDREYGIKEHLADMSGGLDSRMVNWVAKELGYSNQWNINYCQSGSDELMCASKTSAYLGNPFFHFQLDDAGFMFDIEDIISLNYGLAFYSGITGGKRLFDMLDKTRFGVEHTGQLGDVIIGSFSGENRHRKPNQMLRRFSYTIDYEVDNSILSSYKTNEEFAFYNRGFRGVLSTHLIRRHYYYAVSPFIDYDFMKICCSIPMRYRKHHKLYWAWIEKKYPEAASIPSTREKSYTRARMKSWKNRAVHMGKTILSKIGLINVTATSSGMNPYDYWLQTNPKIREFIFDYRKDCDQLLEQYDGIKKEVDILLASNVALDKMLALTVLGFLKKYFMDKGEKR